MTIFFTSVFKVYFARKINKIISKNLLLLAKFWVTNSLFSPAISQKLKSEVVFFLSVLTLN